MNIRNAARLMVDAGSKVGREQKMLPVNMLWPLLMWGCEENDGEMREWIMVQIEGMEGVATDARFTAQVFGEVQRRQDAGKTKVDVRTVMHNIFNSCFLEFENLAAKKRPLWYYAKVQNSNGLYFSPDPQVLGFIDGALRLWIETQPLSNHLQEKRTPQTSQFQNI